MMLDGLAALCAFGGPIFVSQAIADDPDVCEKASGAEAIAACTRAINSGRLQGENLAAVYNNRGIEYYDKGQYDRAIRDFDQSIRLNPDDAKTFANRVSRIAVRASTRVPMRITAMRSGSILKAPKPTTIEVTIIASRGNMPALSRIWTKRSG